ncbi:MBL fold metallo-hydrolase [Tumebacillus sp. ITR2]|uniref:MBL fold metallo-hydrolase n=1 Tax=Tumebacillus amylolyticus TaxID=2801339 RepID=A0ABS1J863_9BACL|nr:MBL fold metallo-hydrolase [Tumebacillus amylolyticus]MBL0386454.1 MBL fold metallo-hydrolase [Tumebacillus amylolyticus]
MKDFHQSPNFREGKFVNLIPTDMNTGFKDTVSMLKDFLKPHPNRKPTTPIAVESVGLAPNRDLKQTKVTWLGHSALLLEVDGKTLLLDPMLGATPSPVPPFGGKRYSKEAPLKIEDLPPIDAVLLSHDHYDHLDTPSIKKLKDKVRKFFVPLGVGSHLVRWGVDPAKIKEHDWWDETEFAGLKLVCTPARHFSGRSLTDRNTTLWASWVILGEQSKIYFSGDSGYGPHFQEIGEKLGPFDLTFMECGQYDERWSTIHMMPEQTVQAHLDVKGNLLIPIHWAAFTLAFHSWTDPIERVTQAAREHGVSISTPRIGETVHLGAAEYPTSTWWKEQS